MDHIEWIFFDLGGTLIDERQQEAYIAKMIHKANPNHSLPFIMQCMAEAAADGLSIRQSTIERLSDSPEQAKELLKTAVYRAELEQLYPEVPALLDALSHRFSLGVLANQEPGARERMKAHGIDPFFSAFFLSSERGVAKPDRRLFRMALEETGCPPSHSLMVGDRLDNDIFPARAIGMHTVRVMQGLNRSRKPPLLSYAPEATIAAVGSLNALLDIP